MKLTRGDIYLVNLDPVRGSEQGKTRPCLIIQNNIGNKYSPTSIVAPLTSKGDENYPFLVKVNKGIANLPKDSFIQLNQIRTISKERLINKIGTLPKEIMIDVDIALKISLGLV